MRAPRRLEQCLNISDLRDLAVRRLPQPLLPYLEGAAEDELTARRNVTAFDSVRLSPRCMVDVSSVSTTIRVLGQDLEWPVICSPTGASRLFHPDGELAVVRAAAKTGTFYGLSTMATHTLEEVARASSGPKLYQLLIFKDRDITHDLIARCRSAGYQALCVTVDTPVRGNCESERRTGLGSKLPLRALMSFALHPSWSLGQLRHGRLCVPVAAERSGVTNFLHNAQFVGTQLDLSATWEDVRQVRHLWPGPFAIKGIMNADDARRAIDVGATAIIVSNHGGRQLDGAAATIEVLPEIVRAAGDAAEIILDGGIRRGVHVLKALALGAKACAVGRAYLFGLAAAGEQGVAKALDILRSELVRAMQLSGCNDVRSIDPTVARHF